MRRLSIVAAAALVAVTGFTAPADAAKRLALIIGNDKYEEVSPLERAVADARAYRALLEDERGFEVFYAENAGRREMNKTVAQFLAAIAPGDMAMVIYSGHGVQLDPNRRDSLYLLPVDFPNEDPGRGAESHFFDSESLNFTRLADNIADRGAKLRVFILDACRNNPFEREGTRSIGMSRGIGRVQSATGEFVIYAAAPGEVAFDSLPTDSVDDTNSVFTRAFIKHFRTGRFLENVANDVQAEVAALTKGANLSQLPYSSDGVPGWTCMDDNCGEDTATTKKEETPDAGLDQSGKEIEELYWSYCADQDDPDFCQAYLDEFPKGPRARLAAVRLKILQAKAKSGGETTPGEGQGETEVTETEDKTKQVDETTESASNDTTETKVDEKKDDVVASIDPDKPKAVERSLINATRDQVRDTQARLAILGFKPGPIDGQMGRKTRAAIQAFQTREGLPSDGRLTNDVFEELVKAVPEADLRDQYRAWDRDARARREAARERQREREAARERQREREAARQRERDRETARQNERDQAAQRERDRAAQAERERQAELARQREAARQAELERQRERERERAKPKDCIKTFSSEGLFDGAGATCN